MEELGSGVMSIVKSGIEKELSFLETYGKHVGDMEFGQSMRDITEAIEFYEERFLPMADMKARVSALWGKKSRQQPEPAA